MRGGVDADPPRWQPADVAHNGARDYDGCGADVNAGEIEAARESLDDGVAVRIALPGRRLAVCTTISEVKAVQRGRIPRDAVRLDRGRTG